MPEFDVRQAAVAAAQFAQEVSVALASSITGAGGRVSLLVECVLTIDALVALAPELDELDALTDVCIPLTGSHWNRLWLKHLVAARWTVRDAVHAFVVRERSG